MTLIGCWRDLMETHELLDRLALLYPDNNLLKDLRRAFVDDDRNSLHRIIKSINDTELTNSIRLLENETSFVTDSLSRGQIESKLWVIDELKKLNLNLGTVFLCAGWYGILATLMFENKLKVDKIRSFDIDKSVLDIAEKFNKKWVKDDWKFKPATYDIHEINYTNFVYDVSRSNGEIVELVDKPDTVINTSCEHIENFSKWYNIIPQGTLLCLQSNDYFGIAEHVNCSTSLDEFDKITPMSETLYIGKIDFQKYSRFMKIGYK